MDRRFRFAPIRISGDNWHITGSLIEAAAGSDAEVFDSPVGCQSRGVTEPWVAGSAGSAAAGESCHRR